METLKSILKFLIGKKGAIASIVGLVVTFLVTQGYISDPVAYLIGGIATILFGTASYATKMVMKPILSDIGEVPVAPIAPELQPNPEA